MPNLLQKFSISASTDGVLLHSTNTDNHHTIENVQISYGTGRVGSVSRREDDGSDILSVEVYGVVGLLNLVSSSHLIAISQREQVAQIKSKSIYAVRDVTVIPLTSREAAEKAILAARKTSKPDELTADDFVEGDTDESDVGEEAETASTQDGKGDEQPPAEVTALEPPKPGVVKRSTGFVKNVVQDKGKYGRFADKWFSKGGGWKSNGKRRQGWTSEDDNVLVENRTGGGSDTAAVSADAKTADPLIPPAQSEVGGSEEAQEGAPKSSQEHSAIEQLTPRILRSAKLYFSTSGFYFSYDHDLSGTLTQRSQPSSSLPLWKRFDSLYFWNRSLINPFIDAGRDELVLPLLQGFVGQRSFTIARTEGTEKDVVADAAEKPEEIKAPGEKDVGGIQDQSITNGFLLTLISRRSVKRAGLRYLRRGVDQEGSVANSVETEQMLSTQIWKSSEKTFSLVQTRGSIPLFFSQSPYSFKPLPIMHGSQETNHAAFQKHLDHLSARYGQIQIASLVDKHGTEVSIGESYENHARQLNERGGVRGKAVGFEWFDFHSACKGMKFENVSILMNALDSSLKSIGWIVKQDDRNIRLQTGVLRTNCMDCLDRTNVVQSAVGSWALQQQLAELGLMIDLQSDPKTQWFNALWADNGDAISKQYAGTAALKGDFTRTRKRNWTGALSDFSLSLNRYFNNVLGDYFLQICIDYYLGTAGPNIFDDFETDMMSKDYAFDMKQIRQNAIDNCVKIVLEDPAEDLVAGWTLSCPKDANTLRTLPFEECVLLLTNVALYFCRFGWDTEKVGSFERIHLLDIRKAWRGAYITSTLGPGHLDEDKNTGFAIRYNTTDRTVRRSNTRSLQNEEEVEDENAGKSELQKQQSPEKDDSRLLAFKILPPKTAAAKDDTDEIAAMSEKELAKHICEEIQRLVQMAMRGNISAVEQRTQDLFQVEETDVISAADARKSTGYIESIGYSLKRLVWS